MNDYKIKMENLEYSQSIPKCGYRKIHNYKRSPYVTKSRFNMVNHAKRHRLPLESSSCERNDLEKYYCKDCYFETDLMVIFKQHLGQYHRKGTDCLQDQPKNDAVVKSYICQKCSFETYSVLLWIKHLNTSCFDTEEESEKVNTVQWYNCDKYEFKTKRKLKQKRHKAKYDHHIKEHETIHLSADAIQWYSCDKCEFKAKRKTYLTRHKKSHLPADAIQWYSCDKCEFETKRKDYLKRHKKNHIITAPVQWLSCDTCEFKTKRNDHLKLHMIKHLPPDAVKWYSCDRCEFRSKRNDNLKRHKERHKSSLSSDVGVINGY
ncbi:unnamed protein product [Tenebrio molitor]|nr:unnamed protein product [Tenebrio molitor]